MATTPRTLTASYNGLALRHAPGIYRSLDSAEFWAKASAKAAWIVMGLPGEWLVVCPADFERLLRAGYESAPGAERWA